MDANAWTGEVTRRTRKGDLRNGVANLVPFVWELHQNLAAGPVGTVILGVVAVLWTLDCLWAVALTLPRSAAGGLRRWALAWRVKQRTSAFRLIFDLHRAGGLWLWPVWLVFAWSSVMFTLPEQVYEPAMSAVTDYRSSAAVFRAMSARPQSDTPEIG